MRPKRHERRFPQASREGLVLNNVQMCARMSNIVRHDTYKKDPVRWSKISVHTGGQGHQYPIQRKRMREVHENAGPLEGEPGLVDPALRTCDLSAFLELCDFSRPPGFLPARIRKIFPEDKNEPP